MKARAGSLLATVQFSSQCAFEIGERLDGAVAVRCDPPPKVLLLTNDNAWVTRLTHPSRRVPRTYRAVVEGQPTE